MIGKVIAINLNNRFIKIQIDNGHITIAEVLDNMPDIGDVLSGNLELLGGETLFNKTQKVELEVFIQDILV